MSLEVNNIKNRGEIDDERVVFKVLLDCDLGMYITFKSTDTESGDGISSHVEYPFWFPDEDIKANDLVVLYTKQGQQSHKLNKDGTHTHFYYRGLNKAIFNKKAERALLMLIKTWSVSKHDD